MSTEEPLREIAILGAGKIGRGVAGLLFSRAGYRLHLYDMYMEGMRKLEAQGYYDVRVTDGHDVDESTRIDDFDIVDSTTDAEVIDLLQSVNIAACCVYEGAFKSLAHVIAEAVSQRHASGNEENLNILLCVNALGAPAKVISYIESELAEEHLAYFREHVGVCQVMVLAAGIPSDPDANPWQVVVSANPGLEIDADAWKGSQLQIESVSFIRGAQGHIYRKVYCGNMRHAMAGFMGKAAGHEFICDCHKDPWIRANIVAAFEEAHAAIVQEYSFDPAEDAEWVEFIYSKLDADVKDPVDRVIAKTDEKLSHDNRFVGPALMCLKHGIVPFYLARGIAYGLDCLAAEQGVELKDDAAVRAYARETCSLSEDEWMLLDLIAKQHTDIAFRAAE